jgi:hypothetical protein
MWKRVYLFYMNVYRVLSYLFDGKDQCRQLSKNTSSSDHVLRKVSSYLNSLKSKRDNSFGLDTRYFSFVKGYTEFLWSKFN